jgi:hypothetical protein
MAKQNYSFEKRQKELAKKKKKEEKRLKKASGNEIEAESDENLAPESQVQESQAQDVTSDSDVK